MIIWFLFFSTMLRRYWNWIEQDWIRIVGHRDSISIGWNKRECRLWVKVLSTSGVTLKNYLTTHLNMRSFATRKTFKCGNILTKFLSEKCSYCIESVLSIDSMKSLSRSALLRITMSSSLNPFVLFCAFEAPVSLFMCKGGVFNYRVVFRWRRLCHECCVALTHVL